MLVSENSSQYYLGVRRSGRCGALALVAALVVAACGDSGGSGPADSDDRAGGPDTPRVVATTSIWADVVSNLACGGIAAVETLVPPGADAHAFEPSLADRERLETASLVVANGLGLEGGLETTLEAVEAEGTPVVRVADHIAILPMSSPEAAGHDHEDEATADTGEPEQDHAHDHEHEGEDPHVWFDPIRVAGALPALAEVLGSEAGLDPDAVDACLTAYGAELEALDAEIIEILAAIPQERRVLVTNHESLGSFADRYGFDVVGTIIPAPSTLAETSPGQLEDLAEAVEATGAPAIFVEHEHSSTQAEALAERVGDVSVVSLHTEALGEPGSGADTYVGFLRTNATAIADALA